MQSFRDVIRRWDHRLDLANDVGESLLVVTAWHNRDSIPAAQFNKILSAARTRGFHDITESLLIDLAEKRAANVKRKHEPAEPSEAA
jgi:hypothetical protein